MPDQGTLSIIVPNWNEREKSFGMLREKAKAGGSGRHPKEIIGCNKAEQPVGYVGRVPYTKQAAESQFRTPMLHGKEMIGCQGGRTQEKERRKWKFE